MGYVLSMVGLSSVTYFHIFTSACSISIRASSQGRGHPLIDASKTPPSRFQHRKGSLYATPGSRDGHVDRNKERDKPFHELADKMKSGLFGGKRRESQGEVEEKSGFFGGRRKSSSRGSDEKKEVVDK